MQAIRNGLKKQAHHAYGYSICSTLQIRPLLLSRIKLQSPEQKWLLQITLVKSLPTELNSPATHCFLRQMVKAAENLGSCPNMHFLLPAVTMRRITCSP